MTIEPLELMTVGNIVRRNGTHFSNKQALVDDERAWTWSEVDFASEEIARRTAALGVRKGDRVVVLAKNSARLVILNYALAKLGAVMVPINYWLRRREIGPLVEDAQATLWVYGPEFADVSVALAEELGIQFVSLSDTAEPRPGLFCSSHPEVTSWSGTVGGTDPYMVIYTSGTTSGRAKGVVRTHAMSYLNAVAAAAEFGVTASDSIVLYTPNFHVSFWDSQMQFVCLRGGRVRIVQKFDASRIVDLLASDSITIVFGITTTYQQLISELESRRTRPAETASVRLAILPARVEPEVVKAVANAFDIPVREVRNGWGMTETGPYAVFLNGDEWVQRPGASGRDSVFTESIIVDSQGRVAPNGELGEILVRGATVATTYWAAPAQTDEVFVGGWLRTGDLGWKDDDGVLHFFERLKSVIKRGGENISSIEVEEYLRRHEAVQDVAVIPVPDDHWGETPLAVVVPAYTPDASTGTDILAFAREGLATFKVPQYIDFVDELPTVSIGKVAKNVLIEHYRERFTPDG